MTISFGRTQESLDTPFEPNRNGSNLHSINIQNAVEELAFYVYQEVYNFSFKRIKNGLNLKIRVNQEMSLLQSIMIDETGSLQIDGDASLVIFGAQ